MLRLLKEPRFDLRMLLHSFLALLKARNTWMLLNLVCSTSKPRMQLCRNSVHSDSTTSSRSR